MHPCLLLNTNSNTPYLGLKACDDQKKKIVISIDLNNVSKESGACAVWIHSADLEDGVVAGVGEVGE
jgi:hypothetical protein